MGPGGFAGGGVPNFAGNAAGTILGINAAATPAYDLVNVQRAGVSCFVMAGTGTVTLTPAAANRCLTLNHGVGAGATIFMNPEAGKLRVNLRFNNFQLGTDSPYNNTNDFWLQNMTSGNVFFLCNATDLVTIGTTNASGGAVLGVASGKVAFYGVTPVVRPAAYTVTNFTGNRALNESTATLAQVAQVLGQVITDLQGLGLLQ